MKCLIYLISLLFCFSVQALCQDLPLPPANIKNMPKGSYIIPMDNTYQLNSSGLFNIKSYGLAVYLLNKKVKMHWVIKSGKLKDGIDFTITSDQMFPNKTATGLSRDFKAGPFVIFKPDTNGVAAFVMAYYAAYGLSGADRPNVYVSTAGLNVDVRYDLVAPKGAILTDGGNQSIHTGYMAAAGIPAQNYALSAGDNLTNCFSFASEPHNTNTGPMVDTAIVHIRKFVLLGGNFLAQCAAVSNYENNVLGRFQTTTGVTVSNTNVGATLLYTNPDLSFSQFEGAYFNYDGASVVQNWTINAAGANNYHTHTTGSGVYTGNIGASVSKLKAGSGGLVFYIGCHDFLAVAPQLLTYNGIRMYMNAFLTPSIFTCPLPLSLVGFSGSLVNGKPELLWTTAENETGDHFEVEKSFDGISFSTAGIVRTTPKEGLESYTYHEPNTIYGNVYYRLKMVNKDYTIKYSKIVALKIKEEANASVLSLMENPVGSTVNFRYLSSSNQTNTVTIYNINGAKVWSTTITTRTGANSFSLALDQKMSSGIYLLEVIGKEGRQIARMVKE
ncbi:MAG: T9SS type A sorting domain-containing protein [Flavisolibacter sp.]